MGTRSTLKTVGAAALMSAVVAACATPITPYQPENKRGEGYAETRLEPGKYRVTFQGNTATDLATVENYILLRAAELTKADGLGHFIILDDDTGAIRSFRSSGTSFGTGFGNAGFRGGFGAGFGGGFGTVSTTSTTRERQAFVVGAIIQAYPGEKPADNPMAFNADALLENLNPVVARADG